MDFTGFQQGGHMSQYDMYRKIYDKEIISKSKGVVFLYSSFTDIYSFTPFTHNVNSSAVEDLGELMRHNLFFYAFGEREVVQYYKDGFFETLQEAAKYAFKQRLPDRSDINDGLPSEALLDLLIQIYNPNAYKLSVRTLFRQDDKNEIKGYDSTYFTKDENGISLWLGQAKLGGEKYCKNSIHKDLLEKFENLYLAKQMFFLCDKPAELTDDAKEILKIIKKLNIASMEEDKKTRAKRLIDCFNQERIFIKIPCLLAYDKCDVYNDAARIHERVVVEAEAIRDYYTKNAYGFNGFVPEIMFYIFPIESIARLRDKETGFYAGLC